MNVPDLAERASLVSRGVPILRLHPRVLENLELNVEYDDVKVARAQVAALAKTTGGWKSAWARLLGTGRKASTVSWDDDTGDGWSVLLGSRVRASELRDALDAKERYEASIEQGVESTTDDEDSSYLG